MKTLDMKTLDNVHAILLAQTFDLYYCDEKIDFAKIDLQARLTPGWMIANVWTDDVRYFGTDDVMRYDVCTSKVITYKLYAIGLLVHTCTCKLKLAVK